MSIIIKGDNKGIAVEGDLHIGAVTFVPDKGITRVEDIELMEEVKTPSFQSLIFFSEHLFCTDERKEALRNLLLPIVTQRIEIKADWYAVLRGIQCVKDAKDKFGKKNGVITEGTSEVALFADIASLVPEVLKLEKIFPIDENTKRDTLSDRYNALRKAVSDERPRWTVGGRELDVCEWKKTEFNPCISGTTNLMRINNKSRKYERMSGIASDVMVGIITLRKEWLS